MTRGTLILLLGALLLCARASAAEFSFAVTSDMRGFTRGQERFEGVLKALRGAGPGAFMLTPGDEDPVPAAAEAIAAALGKDYPWYPAVGNHDTGSSDMAWLRAHNRGGRALPGAVRAGPRGSEETTYSFDHEDAHFVVLDEYYDGRKDDSGTARVCDELYGWLKADLEANRKPVVFVVGHVPMLVGPDADAAGRLRHQGSVLDSDPKELRRFHELLRQHHVRAYICGHTHATSYMQINGVWQLDAGHSRGVGAGDEESPSSFILVRVKDGSATADIYRSDAKGGGYALKHTVRLD